jgi:GTP-binding protein
MEIKTAEFVSSHAVLGKLPRPDRPEFAFIGRSNVGKSSLINYLCHRKGLAKTSGTPGKTQTINHFIINDQWYMVDLPGYGYAKVNKALKAKWQGFTFDYLKKRANLLCVFVLLDIRLEPQKIDIEFMEWMATLEIPFVMCFTKSDKLTANQAVSHVAHYKKTMMKTWESLPEIFITSADARKGREDVLEFIESVIKQTGLL